MSSKESKFTAEGKAMQRVVVPQLPLVGPKDHVLQFPAGWDVEMRPMAGHNRPEVTEDHVRKALRNPVGTPSLRQLARGKKEVVIIVDDNARGMRWNKIAHIMLEELESAGIGSKSIRFIFALGAHGCIERTVMVRKLGEDIVSNYYCFNHNAFTMCEKIGTTKTWNIDVYANKEVMACDLKIGLGVITPHPINGFGGGSKIIMPGVVSYETIVDHHRNSFEVAGKEMAEAIEQDRSSKVGLGLFNPEQAPAVDADDEMAEMVGLDFVVNGVVNTYGKLTGVWAGDFRKAFYAGIEDARENYATEGKSEQDIVIGNCFYKNSEDMIGLTAAPRSLKRSGGSMVLVSNCPEGICNHYFVGTWGTLATVPNQFPVMLPDYVKHLIIYNEYSSPADFWAIEPKEKVLYISRWDDVLAKLQEWHPGNPSVVVYPDVTVQYAKPKGRFLHHEIVPTY